MIAYTAHDRYAAELTAIASLSHKRETAPSTWHPQPHQVPPDTDWRFWLLLGGRDAGKTDAGAHLMDLHANGVACLSGPVPHRMAIIAPSDGDATQTCVIGETGILRANPRIRFAPTAAKTQDLLWPNGAVANLFGAFTPEDIERLRGPQHCYMWLDELAAWRKLAGVWMMLNFGLRLGPHPRAIITTTPKARQILKEIMAMDGVEITRAKTSDNKYVSAERIAELYRQYGGTVIGRQELDAELIEEVPGALWSRGMIAYRRPSLIHDHALNALIPDLERVVVAIDPAATSGEKADETGLIVAGRHGDVGYTLDDLSGRYSPPDWARLAIRAYREHHADIIVAEANNGGEMVAAVIHAIDSTVPVNLVHASRGKITRAEPVAVLYREGKIAHAEPFPELEDQMCLAADTTVLTDRGDVAIRDVRMGWRVLTRAGWRTVLWSGQTGVRETVRVETRAGTITCTGTHPIYVDGRGFVPADELRPGDALLSWHGNPFVRSSSLTERGTSWMTTAITRRLAAVAAGSITEHSGLATTAQSRRDGTSTTGITSGATTLSPTSSLSPSASTFVSTSHEVSGPSRSMSSRPGARLSGPSSNRPVMSAPNARRGSGHAARELPTAPPPATNVIAIGRGFVQPVYNLTVHEQPEFYANGLLVHNCTYTGDPLEKSPDRMDALVWAYSELFRLSSSAAWGGGKSWGGSIGASVA